MSQEDGKVYLLREEGSNGWVSPTPARQAIVDALTDATDLGADDVGDLEDYVDPDDLRDLLEDEDAGALSFDVEDHQVTVDSGGTVTIAG
jgi:hypothetical protein